MTAPVRVRWCELRRGDWLANHWYGNDPRWRYVHHTKPHPDGTVVISLGPDPYRHDTPTRTWGSWAWYTNRADLLVAVVRSEWAAADDRRRLRDAIRDVQERSIDAELARLVSR